MKNIKITWNEFDATTQILAKQIETSKMQFSSICGIPRGGLIIAVRLSHLLNIPLIENESLSSHAMLRLDLESKKILIVDDVADTGKTLHLYALHDYPIATLYWNPESSIQPKFWVKRKSSKEWIVFPWESNSEN